MSYVDIRKCQLLIKQLFPQFYLVEIHRECTIKKPFLAFYQLLWLFICVMDIIIILISEILSNTILQYSGVVYLVMWLEIL